MLGSVQFPTPWKSAAGNTVDSCPWDARNTQLLLPLSVALDADDCAQTRWEQLSAGARGARDEAVRFGMREAFHHIACRENLERITGHELNNFHARVDPQVLEHAPGFFGARYHVPFGDAIYKGNPSGLSPLYLSQTPEQFLNTIADCRRTLGWDDAATSALYKEYYPRFCREILRPLYLELIRKGYGSFELTV